MKQFKAIFIKYFATFFSISLALVWFDQYKNQVKLDLQYSLTLSFLVAILGATLSAIFIGSLKTLEDEPPWVQPSDYLQTDMLILNRQLTKIRYIKNLILTMFFMWLPYGMIIIMLKLPEFLVYPYFVAMIIISFMFQYAKCPRCGHYLQRREAKISILRLIYHYPWSDKCLNCGLSIKGNI